MHARSLAFEVHLALGMTPRLAFVALSLCFAWPALADVHIGDDVSVESYATGDVVISEVNHHWYPYVGGDARDRLESTDFYRLVGRDDLARRHERRRNVGAVLAAGGGVTAVAGGMMVAGLEGRPGYQTAGLVAATTGVLVFGLGIYYLRHPDPISEDDARDLAANYNADQRARARRSQARVTVSPYASAAGGGVALGGAF